ncbi:intraflagellar transport protein 80 homolog [Temnothorax curvispinosus]|uniref:Intraflagellar transport protein 80 homolog n=1 Tax=Temnothorax curvispinosus TaxID=300111 RepID=A0A6J1PKY2_9HYME|nr:intraflagellar transport protein 80 homolog [Temnothorax curvispinosus]
MSLTTFYLRFYLRLRRCNDTNWSHSMEKVNTGSIYSIAWSSDSTQVAMACSNGKLLTGHIIDSFSFDGEFYEQIFGRVLDNREATLKSIGAIYR